MKQYVDVPEGMAAAIGAEMDGIVTTAAMLDAGCVRFDVERLRRRGVLQTLGAGVSKLRDHPWTWRTRCRAALALAGPDAALCLRAAARLHGFYAYRDVDDIEVVVLRGGHQRRSTARLVETRKLPPEHVTVVDGFRCTTIARTFFDLCGDPDHGMRVSNPYHAKRMRAVYNDAVARRGLSFVHELAVLHVMARRGRAGTVLVRQLLERYGPDYEPTWSDAESLLVEIVDDHGLPAPDKQVALGDEEGWIGTVDFLWRKARLVVEVDSRWHDGPLDKEHDAERDRRLQRAGYTVKRFRYGQLALEPDRVAAELAAILLR